MTAATRIIACVAAASTGACTHAYVFSGDSPPRFVEGQVVIERIGEEPERFPVERVLVQEPKSRARLPSSAELEAWSAGRATPGLDMIRVDVSSSSAVWRDWVLPGFGIGASLILVTLGGLGAIEPGSDGTTGISMPFALLLATALGLEGALIGAGIGALAEGGTTDMRVPGGAPLGTDAWPLDAR